MSQYRYYKAETKTLNIELIRAKNKDVVVAGLYAARGETVSNGVPLPPAQETIEFRKNKSLHKSINYGQKLIGKISVIEIDEKEFYHPDSEEYWFESNERFLPL